MENGMWWQITGRRHELASFLYVNTESRRGKSPGILKFSNIWKCADSLTGAQAAGLWEIASFHYLDSRFSGIPQSFRTSCSREMLSPSCEAHQHLWKCKPLNLVTVKSLLFGEGSESCISTPASPHPGRSIVMVSYDFCNFDCCDF